MGSVETARAYFDCWNRRDPAAIAAIFTPDGTYSDPSGGAGLRGAALEAYSASLFAGFPDLSFDLRAQYQSAGGPLVWEWLMRGTNTGPLGGGPPTGGTVALPGIDVITVEGDRVASVVGYFDRGTMFSQLGLQVSVQPYRIGPAAFGTAMHLDSGNPAPAGAFAITWIDVRSPEEGEDIATRTRAMVPEMRAMSGFLGLLTGRVGTRLYTVSAWETPEQPRQLLRGKHRELMTYFHESRTGTALGAGVYVPHRAPAPLARCECGMLVRCGNPEGRCRCGRAAPATPPAW